jgi:O-acetyl-ADP-ribose deacetylase (regulator of RNase III)
MTVVVEIIDADITTLAVAAIVNAANPQLLPGGGVCGAIHAAAGPRLAEECAQLGGCPTGEARITSGHNLKAAYVIHAVGPVWRGGDAGEAALLAGCYRACYALADENRLKSIAFPAISTGIFGYPLETATDIAIAEAKSYAERGDGPLARIVFCCFGADVTAAYRHAHARLFC